MTHKPNMCRWCGIPIKQTPKMKKRFFCCTEHRVKYHNTFK